MMFIGTEGVVFEPDAYWYRASRDFPPQERFADVKKGNGRRQDQANGKAQPKCPIIRRANGLITSCMAAAFRARISTTRRRWRNSYPSAISPSAPRKTIQWDAKEGKVTNVEAANRFVKRPSYRGGWI